ncbi:TrmH family RNA methyltransferase [Gloeobacter kilaueensis]|uniref:tRNA/rRNA methyltransferase (SpoU) n=1 Tax=Gloeobacter kilaueensis (strain ATCC BAA-2537 / CCAP 1431/1 / ULC 316 / JS1) TaxID=1183438 RepID=U5QKB3_GLOK1|nr:RNA methyltransferase [Gloeobacter kilaueensis]AGY58135.1 tRNA/rRNA methyltransferase (SpoU) [Gloeobacter kilaueensis JS1]
MLTSRQNPLIKQLRKLHSAKERSEAGLFLVEGTHPVLEAVQSGWKPEVVLVTEDWGRAHPGELSPIEKATARLEVVSPAVLEAVADTVHPSGIVAALRRRERSWETLLRSGPSLLVLGETLQDPGNVGTIVRSCAAVGADGLILSADSVDPEHPKVLRASAGLWFQNPPLRCLDLEAVIEALLRQNVQVLAAAADGQRTFWQYDLMRPSAFVLGSEGQGLSPALRGAISESVRIPLAPGVESLNVAVSCALLLFEVARQRQPAL